MAIIEFLNNSDAILNFEHIAMHCGLSRVIQVFSTVRAASTVAFFPRACTHGEVYILLTFTNEITNGQKDNIQPYV